MAGTTLVASAAAFFSDDWNRIIAEITVHGCASGCGYIEKRTH